MNRKHIATALAAISLSLAPGLLAQQTSQPAPPQPPAPKVLHFGTWGVDLAGMDRSVNPADDFDRYVNGAWSAKTEIPGDQASAGVGYDVFNLHAGPDSRDHRKRAGDDASSARCTRAS